MKITRHIPNLLTCGNLLCGATATFFALNGMISVATWLILAGALFDFSDGFAARLFKAYSEIGKELDSLADLITFGVAPSAIYSTYIKYYLTGSFFTPVQLLSGIQLAWIIAPFILSAFAALRLAKFNIDTRQSENFLGLTTTATGIFTASLGYMIVQNAEYFSWLRPSFVISMILFICVMLVSEVPMFSFKFKHYRWKGNEDRFVLLIMAIVALVLLGIGGLAPVILYYVVFSLVRWMCYGKKASE